MKKLKGKNVGIVFGTFAPLHQGHIDLIMQAKRECDGGCIVISGGRDGDRGGEMMPLSVRYELVKEYFEYDDLIEVFSLNETELGIESYPDGWGKFMEEVERIFSSTAEGNPVFYVGEGDYAEYLSKFGYDVVKLDRTINPISATMIRNDPLRYWHKIAYTFTHIFENKVKHQMIKNKLLASDDLLRVSDLAERFIDVDEYFDHSPWNLYQILNNIDMIVPYKKELRD